MKKSGLGRGLDALIPNASKSTTEPFIELDIASIVPNSYQPRLEISESSLAELAASIRENGVVQPVLVRRRDMEFQLVAGERRWRAAQMAGLRKIPAVIREIPEDKMLEFALIENIQREDLNLIEQAKSYQKLIETLNLSQEEVAKRVGKERSSVTNILRLLRLPEKIQTLIAEGSLSFGHAKVLMGIESEAIQLSLTRDILVKGFSVREIEKLSHRLPKTKKKAKIKFPGPDPNSTYAERNLQAHLGTKVKFKRVGKGGKIEIEFYSEGDLHRIYSLILGKQSAQAGIQPV